ncbi:hypothetical protein MXD81_18020, partial [Microbacteriaceae bacterium K1510]|nr:hypothetical protein [Microbacteriaceae bacterium K1510]
MSGFVDKVERMPRTFAVERKRSRAGKTAPPRRLPVGPSEEQIQKAVVEWLDRRGVPGMHFFHVPNGDIRHSGAAGRLKGMGTKAGEPDLV